MSLLSLPTEILIEIFDYVGSSYFRSNLSRLTICKEWSVFARTACFQECPVTQKNLRDLISSPHVDSSLALLKDSVKTLDLDLKGIEDWDATPTWDIAHKRAAWTTELNNDLLHLATTMKQSRKLRTLHIKATNILPSQLRLLEHRDYLFLSPMRTFLTAGNLTSLELDLLGTDIGSQSDHESDEGVHICPIIATLLTTLRRLRLRMESMCTDVLEVELHITNLRLDTVLINLGLSEDMALTVYFAHLSRCGYPQGPNTFWDDMENQAQILVTQMAAPKMVRILTVEIPDFSMRAFDVLTGRTVKLDQDAKWDDDGEVIEDDGCEPPELSPVTSLNIYPDSDD
jgi:hypothetical protein